jgi:hypothetical protein
VRDKVYVHSDETDARVAVDRFAEHAYVEGYRVVDEATLRVLVELAHSQQLRFEDALHELQEMLRAADVPADSNIEC